jgi:hypothetical protein
MTLFHKIKIKILVHAVCAVQPNVYTIVGYEVLLCWIDMDLNGNMLDIDSKVNAT